MVGNPTLWEIVGPDFCRTITRAHQTFPMACNFFFLFAHLLFVQFGANHLHGFSRFPIAIVPFGTSRPCRRNMCKNNLGFNFVYILTAGAAASCSIHFHVGIAQFEIHFFRLRHHCHRRSAGVNTAAGLSVGYPLHTVNTTFKFQCPIHFISSHFHLHFFVSPTVPSLSLRMAVFQPLLSQ